jgi:hypothetical protein
MRGDDDGTTHRQAPPIFGGYGVMQGNGNCRSRPGRGCRQRGPVGSATATRSDGLGAAASVDSAAPSASLCSIPSRLTCIG